MEYKIAIRVKELRKERGLSQLKLAIELELSSGYIADIEQGRTMVSVPTLVLLAKFFDVTTDYLLGLVD